MSTQPVTRVSVNPAALDELIADWKGRAPIRDQDGVLAGLDRQTIHSTDHPILPLSSEQRLLINLALGDHWQTLAPTWGEHTNVPICGRCTYGDGVPMRWPCPTVTVLEPLLLTTPPAPTPSRDEQLDPADLALFGLAGLSVGCAHLDALKQRLADRYSGILRDPARTEKAVNIARGLGIVIGWVDEMQGAVHD